VPTLAAGPVEIVAKRASFESKKDSPSRPSRREPSRGARRARRAEGLLDEGRTKVEQVERLVCDLYDLDDELTGAVIAHAVERAGRASG